MGETTVRGRLPADRRWTAALLGALVFQVATRLAWVLHLAGVPFSDRDQESFEKVALAIAHHGRFRVPEEYGYDASFFRPPGYPLFVAAVYRVFHDSRTAVVVTQVVLGAVTAYVAYLIGRRLWSDAAGVVAAVLVAVEPLLFWSDGQFLSETLSACALTVSWYAAIRLIDAARSASVHPADAIPRWATSKRITPAWATVGWAVALGMTVAWATLVRPTTYYFPLVAVTWWLVAGRGVPRAVRVGVVAALVVPSVLACGAWQLRNQAAVGSARFSGVESYNMLGFDGAAVAARQRGISFNDAQDQVLAEFGQPRRGESQGHFYDRMYDRGWTIVTGDLWGFAVTRADALVGVVVGANPDGVPLLGPDPDPWVPVALHLAHLGVLALVVVGCVGGLRVARVRSTLGFGLLLVGWVVGMSALGGGSYFRFRVPVTPSLCVVAGGGAWMAARWVGSRRRRDADRSAPAGPAGGTGFGPGVAGV